jgi:hypothetical protein
MATYPPFINAVRLTTSAVTVNVAGQPGDDLGGYRIAGYKGASPNWVLSGVYVIPAGTIIPASGVKKITPTFAGGQPAVFGIAAPDANPNAATGLGNLVQVFAASLTVSKGPFIAVSPAYIGQDISTSGTNYAGLIGTGSTANYSTFTWSRITGTIPNELTNTGQTLTISEPPEDPPDDPEDPPADEPTALVAAVSAFLGQTGNTVLETQIASHVDVIAALAKSYTRGNGFTDGEPDETITKVIVSATARLVANPEQTETQVGTVVLRSYFTGFSVIERLVLNEYRGVAS